MKIINSISSILLFVFGIIFLISKSYIIFILLSIAWVVWFVSMTYDCLIISDEEKKSYDIMIQTLISLRKLADETDDQEYANNLRKMADDMEKDIKKYKWVSKRIQKAKPDKNFIKEVTFEEDKK